MQDDTETAGSDEVRRAAVSVLAQIAYADGYLKAREDLKHGLYNEASKIPFLVFNGCDRFYQAFNAALNKTAIPDEVAKHAEMLREFPPAPWGKMAEKANTEFRATTFLGLEARGAEHTRLCRAIQLLFSLDGKIPSRVATALLQAEIDTVDKLCALPVRDILGPNVGGASVNFLRRVAWERYGKTLSDGKMYKGSGNSA